ncbi:MAG TPA: vWA domain-containing protein [Fibrobacteria bacterium]|nr:vWA domain-containing protein [Fibrobacteria bacterium]
MTLSLGATGAQAAKRCDWHGPLSGGENPYAKCVDFAALQGKTLDLPKNVTRISADGLSFCQPATPTTGTGDADIVFIYDNSGSMTAEVAYIAPGTTDTSFYYLDDKTNRCGDNPKSGTITFATKEGLETIPKLVSNADCNSSYAGDPYFARGSVIKAGIDFLAASSPTSTAGAISFNSDIGYLQPPVLMNNPVNVNQIKASINLDRTGGTIYRKPLVRAKAWLNDASVIQTKKQAIIFISDGAPNDPNNYLDLVDSRMPPIFSIYMSKAVTADTAKLKELSDRTGGTFTRVNSNDPTAMETLLKSIISTITKNTLPKAATITNKSISPPQTSKSTGVKANPDGSAGMALDSIIGLKEGVNQIEIRLTREDNTESTYAFNMNVAGKDISSSGGNYSCWDMPTLTAVDKATGQVPQIYDPDKTSYDLKLTRSPSELKTAAVDGASANKDKESIVLRTMDLSLGYPIQTGEFTYNPAKPNPGLNNGTLEVDGKGDLTFVWSHPRDVRETVTYILPGRVVPVLNGDATLHIKEPVTQGVTFDPGSIKGKDPVVVLDGKEHCVLNCAGTENFHSNNGVPTWQVVVKSPFKYSIRLFDNLGQFVCESKGEMSAADWAKVAKTGDSASIQMKIIPVSKDGQQLGTGAYVMHAEITAMGDQVTRNSAGESIIVRNGKTEYLKRFGYVRR